METRVTLPNYTERKKAAAIEPANFYIFESLGFRPFGDIDNYKESIIEEIIENELTDEIFTKHTSEELRAYVTRNFKLDEYYYDCVNEEINDILDAVKYSNLNNETYIICGTVGAWQGLRTVEHLEPKNLYNAISLCLGNSDDFSIYCEEGEIHIKTMHHDGTNNFYIKMLSQKGLENLANYQAGECKEFDASDPANFEKIMQDYL